ncbi:hypothetical protein B0H19DRAFT_1257757 [Mycena capillaripes]|nr:hypothetical protein B0H19DRAFT_1257757 [Mycena capillaripes]
MFTMHPYSNGTRTSTMYLSCDVLYLPSSRNILDRSMRTPIPYETLDEPATEPTVYSQLILKCDLSPWGVPMPLARRPPSRRASRSRAGGPGVGTARAEEPCAAAYEQRCIKLGGGWEAGVRRIDWLHGRTGLVGNEMIPSTDGIASNAATLILKTPA